MTNATDALRDFDEALAWVRHRMKTVPAGRFLVQYEDVIRAALATPTPQAGGDDVTHERDLLANAIRDAAVKAGIVDPDAPLTGPHLLMLCDNLTTAGQQAAGVSETAVQTFAAWFRHNYPGPDTIISDPDWHAPRIFRQVAYAIRTAAGAAPEGDLLALQQFAVDILGDEEIGSLDGGDIQDTAEACGLLIPTEVTEACGEACMCAGYGDFPMTCYRRSPILRRAYKADDERRKAAAPQPGAQEQSA